MSMIEHYQNNGFKTCPFCGGYVLFEEEFALWNGTFRGECTECHMKFEYREKHEESTEYINNIPFSINSVKVDKMKRVNPSFKDAWNRRVN